MVDNKNINQEAEEGKSIESKNFSINIFCIECLIHDMMDENEWSQNYGEQTYQNIISGRQR